MNAAPEPQTFIGEIETDVLGALLVEDCYPRVSNILLARHFLDPLHGVIFDHIRQAHERFGVTNPVVVHKLFPTEEAAALGARHNVRLSEYLAKLAANCTFHPNRIEYLARRVVEQWARTALASEAAVLNSAASDPRSNPVDLVTAAGQAFDDILADVRRGPKRKTRVSIGRAAENAFLATQEAMQRGSGLTGITWGLTDVNRLTGGMQRRDLTLVAARPSMGKSTLGLGVAIRAAKSGAGVGFISLEMDSDKLAARAISDLAYDWHVKVPYADLIRGRIEPADLESVKAASKEIAGLPLWIEDQSGLSMTDIRVKTEAMLDEAERAGVALGGLFIDHIGLIKPSSRYQGNRVNEVAEITAGLKSLAREYGIAVIALSQLSRALEQRNDKRPQLSDLRDSGAIEQDADTIIFLYREAYYLQREKGGSADAIAQRGERLADCENKLELHIAKQRNGPIQTVDLFADMGCSAVRNGARI